MKASTIFSLAAALGWTCVAHATAEDQKFEPRFRTIEDLVATPVAFELALSEEAKSGSVRADRMSGISIRGVFPIDEQLDELARHLKIDNAEAAERFDLRDFVIERQELADNAPFSANPPWTPKSVKEVTGLFELADDFAPDIVPNEQTEPVITMPLPAKTDGPWDEKTVGHPALKNGVKAWLFRFFDLDVKPNYYYRYRVKLVVRNPNHDRFRFRFGPVDQDPLVARGETRETPWSQPSRSILIQGEANEN